MHLPKWKKPISKDYTLYDSNIRYFGKDKIIRCKKISGCDAEGL
jgi:hypothetical protein